MSTTDDDTESARAEHAFAATSSGIGVDDGPDTAPSHHPAAASAPWPDGPFMPPVPAVPVAGGGTSASRGHPGHPGFARHDVPAAPGEGPVWSVWQHAQRAWHAAGAEWHAAAVSREISAAPRDASPPAQDGAARGARLRFRRPSGRPNGPAPDSNDGPAPAGQDGKAPAGTSGPIPAARSRRTPDGRTRRGVLLTAVAALAVVAAGSGYAALDTGGLAARSYPAASLAGAVFAGDGIQAGQGVAQTMGRVASDGDTAVALGSQAGGDIPRAQFFVSGNDGKTWRLAAVTAPGGGAPAPGHAAQLIVHGQNGWLAVGPDAIWTSATGQSWTLAAPSGITPVDAGDQLSVLAQTGRGFLAAGQNTAEGTAVVWTSPDGLHWQRMTAVQLLLPAGGGIVADLTSAAAHGRDILLAGHMTTASGARTAATWLSTDEGRTWKWAPVPVDHGATSALAGIAANGAGFVAIRPGSGSQGPQGPQGPRGRSLANGVVYVSADGTSWRYVATLTAADGVQFGMVEGGPGGFAALGRGPGGDMAAYVSADGLSWPPGIAFGPAPASVNGATVTAGGTVIVTGSTGPPGRQQPYLALAPPGQAARAVHVATIPGGTISQVSVDAVAVSGNQRVAVGEAGGAPAIWTATGPSWSSASAGPATASAATSSGSSAASSPDTATPGAASAATSGSAIPDASAPDATAAGSSATPGADAQKLTSVVHGPAGWLATGEAVSGPAQRPLLVTSSDATVWKATGQDRSAFQGARVVAAQSAAGRAGYVIAGSRTTSAGTFPAAWWSRDLRTWTRAGGPASGGAAQDDPGQMLGVTAGPSGFVAVGTQGISPAVWTSRDGRTWRKVTLKVPAGAASASLWRVAVSGQHVVAVGGESWSSGARAAFAEVSANGGRTWRPAELASPHGDAIVTALTPVRGGFTAVGAFGTPGHRNVVVWTSPDGGGWTVQVPNGPGLSGHGIQEVTGLAAAGDGSLTGVGFTASASGEQPILWNVPAR